MKMLLWTTEPSSSLQYDLGELINISFFTAHLIMKHADNETFILRLQWTVRVVSHKLIILRTEGLKFSMSHLCLHLFQDHLLQQREQGESVPTYHNFTELAKVRNIEQKSSFPIPCNMLPHHISTNKSSQTHTPDWEYLKVQIQGKKVYLMIQQDTTYS